ncbi:MAG: sulfatase-like hydrolase/transferase [Rikenellaceae bacterium]
MKTLLPLTTLSLLAVSSNSFAKDVDTRPNIMFVTCEDISLFLGCYGDTVSVSPNIDKFAEESILFTQMHTTVGVSAPSRFALITGMYPSAMGANYMRTYTNKKEQYPADITPYYVILPDEVKGFTEYMREAGYYCVNRGKTDYQFNVPISLWDENTGNADWKKAPKDRPFYAMVNLMITHESNIWNQNKKPLIVDPKDVEVPPYYPDDDVTRHDIAVMYSNIARMDSQFQEIIDDLKREEVYDNTILILLSDNGGPLPRQKRAVYESGTHVPFLVRLPDGVGAGTVDDRLAMFVDFPATILSLAGIDPPKYMHGEPLLGKYASSKERKYVYAARDRMDEKYDKQGAVRDHKYRYVRNYDPSQPNYMGVQYRFNMPLMCNMWDKWQKGELNEIQSLWFDIPRPAEEFYDDVADPHSVSNLIDDPAYAEDIKRLRKEYDRWVAKYNGRWLLTEQQSRDMMLPNNAPQPTLSKPTITSKRGKITISSDNAGASIVYRINGKGCNDRSWFLYTAPIEGVESGDSITAIASRAGYKDSKIAEFRQ